MRTQVGPLSEPKPFPLHEDFLLSYHNHDHQNVVTTSSAPCSRASFWINTICSERPRGSENVAEMKAFYPTSFSSLLLWARDLCGVCFSFPAVSLPMLYSDMATEGRETVFLEKAQPCVSSSFHMVFGKLSPTVPRPLSPTPTKCRLNTLAAI